MKQQFEIRLMLERLKRDFGASHFERGQGHYVSILLIFTTNFGFLPRGSIGKGRKIVLGEYRTIRRVGSDP